jgi:hypothetical protein
MVSVTCRAQNPGGFAPVQFATCNQALDPLAAMCQRAVRRQVGRKPLTHCFESSTRSAARLQVRRVCGDPGTSPAPVVLAVCKLLHPSAEHRRDDPFVMLAGTEPVDAVVEAAARIGVLGQLRIATSRLPPLTDCARNLRKPGWPSLRALTDKISLRPRQRRGVLHACCWRTSPAARQSSTAFALGLPAEFRRFGRVAWEQVLA